MLLVLAAMGVGGLASAAPGETQTPTLPNPFGDACGADAAGDRSSLWVLITGRGDGRCGADLEARVFRTDGTRAWQLAPPLPASVGGDSRSSLTVWNGDPCIGFTTAGSARVSCLEPSGWQEVGRLPSGSQFIDLVTFEPDALTALVRRRGRFEVQRRSGGGWRRLGPPLLRRNAIASIATSGRRINVLVQTFGGAPRREVLRLANRRWSPVNRPLTGVPVGAQVTGPLHSGSTTLIPVSDGRGGDFSVYSSRSRGAWRRVGGRPLNRGPGYTQGGLFRAGSSTWAAWQQHNPAGRGAFDTVVSVARIEPRSRKVSGRQELYRGVTIGPGALDVLTAAGRTWALIPVARDAQNPGLNYRVLPLDD